MEGAEQRCSLRSANTMGEDHSRADPRSLASTRSRAHRISREGTSSRREHPSTLRCARRRGGRPLRRVGCEVIGSLGNYRAARRVSRSASYVGLLRGKPEFSLSADEVESIYEVPSPTHDRRSRVAGAVGPGPNRRASCASSADAEYLGQTSSGVSRRRCCGICSTPLSKPAASIGRCMSARVTG